MTTYATLQQVKDEAGLQDAVDDLALSIALEAASRSVDAYCERVFSVGTAAEARVYIPDHSWLVRVDDIAGTAITVKTASNLDGVFDLTWGSSDFQAEPLNRRRSGLAWPTTQLRAVDDLTFPVDSFGSATVQVTAVYGFADQVPDAVRLATILLALRYFSRRNSPQGVIGFSDIGVARVSRFDYDVQGLLAPYRLNPVGLA